jgi:hypothetical protein
MGQGLANQRSKGKKQNGSAKIKKMGGAADIVVTRDP